MSLVSKSITVFLGFFIHLCGITSTDAWGQQNPNEVRVWTNQAGQTMQAILLRRHQQNLTFQLINGQQASFDLHQLSEADQAYIQANFPDPINTSWPDVVEVKSSSIDVKLAEENPEKRRYIYRSQNFQFEAQDKLAVSVMKEIARTFEATHALLNALPWSIEPIPPADLGYYQAKFYLNRRNYILDGGPENSGGVYSTQDRIFRIPFESLGLEMRGKTWFKNADYRNDTLMHEVAHQMMHGHLNFLPMWIIEGSAEYAEMLPSNAGKIYASSHQRGMKEYLRKFEELKGISFREIQDISALMSMTSTEWTQQALLGSSNQARLYLNSTILVYFFCHLDGDGSGQRYVKYMNTIAKARDEWSEFFNHPAVKNDGKGNISFPASMKVPAATRNESYGRSLYPTLLDGRSLEQLNEEIRSAYRKIGIR